MDALIAAGIKKYNKGDFASALKDFEKALARDPANAQARFFRDRASDELAGRGVALRDTQDPEAPQKEKRESMPADSKRKPGEEREARALALMRAGRWAEGLNEIAAACRLEPKSAHYLSLKAEAEDRLGRKSEALASLTKALRLDPRSVSFLEKSVRLQMELGDNAAAAKLCRRALALEPGRWPLLQMLASLERQAGSVPRSMAVLRRALPLVLKAIRRGPPTAQWELDAAEVYEDLADLPHSLKYLERAASVEPSNLRAQEKLAQIHLWLGDYPAAKRFAAAALRLKQDSEVGARVQRTAGVLEKGSWRDGGKDWEAVKKELSMEPLCTPIRLRAARSLAGWGRSDEALELCRQAVAVSGGAPQAKRLLAALSKGRTA